MAATLPRSCSTSPCRRRCRTPCGPPGRRRSRAPCELRVQQALAAPVASRPTRRRYQPGDAIFAFLARFSGAFVLILLGGLILSLLIGGLPAFRHFGLGFIVSTDWDPVQQVFGAAVSIYGTLLTSLLALLLAVPLAFGIAFYLTEL